VITIDGVRYACPVEPPYSYVDTWGAARASGRTHEGTDIMAPRGARELAYTDGMISREHTNTLGGIVLWLDGDNGDQYYYAHLSAYAVPHGTRVRAGQHIAYVGNTGDARYTAPHLHFEVHPGGGAAVNPYPYVERVCG
jgi:murein DD-endopeptidase MepM/ murein hydrolase activator NlpD